MSEDTREVLLLWSGGISSTVLLLELLSDRKYKRFDILVHHCRLRDMTIKDRAEALACKKIIDYIENKKKYRKFFFSESSHETLFMQPPRYSRGIALPDMVSFVAANMCVGRNAIEKVMFGGTQAELKQNSGYPEIAERAGAVFSSVMKGSPNTEKLGVEYPLIDEEIGDMIDELPRAVKKMVFSCQHPSYDDDGEPVACGKCDKCLQREL